MNTTTFSSLSILFWVNKNRTNAKGEVPIYARVTVNGKRSEISLQRSVPAEYWDQSAQKIKPKYDNSKIINSYLDLARGKIQTIYNQLVSSNQTITADTIKNKFNGKENSPRSKTIVEAFDYHNLRVDQLVQAGKLSAETLLRYKITKNKVVDFMQSNFSRDDINLTELKYSFITDLEHYLFTKQKLGNNTCYKYIKNFKKVITMAVNNDWLPKNPFTSFKSHYHWKDREILTQEEINILTQKTFSSERLTEVRDVFVFCCYTGFAYADVHKFEQDAVMRGLDGEYWLKTNRQKSKVKESVPLLPKALEIIQKYQDNNYCIVNNKLLPVKSNQKYNEYIQEIATLCGIKKHLTTHIARHTFATTITLSNGVPIETVSSMLGHKNIKTTQIYAKVVEQKVSEDMKLLKQKMAQLNIQQSEKHAV